MGVGRYKAMRLVYYVERVIVYWLHAVMDRSIICPLALPQTDGPHVPATNGIELYCRGLEFQPTIFNCRTFWKAKKQSEKYGKGRSIAHPR